MRGCCSVLLVAPLALAAAGSLAWPAAGERQQAWLGVALSPERVHEAEDSEPFEGARVGGVVDGGPAETAGLRARDVIMTVDGSPVTSPAGLVGLIQQHEAGAWIDVHLLRGGDDLDLRVLLEARPADTDRLRMVRGSIGVEAIDLPPGLQEHFGAPDGSGVMISSVAAGSPAEAAGLDLGDVVFEGDGEPLSSAGELARLVATSGVGNKVELHAMRNGGEIVVSVGVEKASKSEDP